MYRYYVTHNSLLKKVVSICHFRKFIKICDDVATTVVIDVRKLVNVILAEVTMAVRSKVNAKLDFSQT